MRQDQLVMLRELQEKLADVFLMEADPANWSGAGKLPNDMDKDERGNRVWEKRGAMATGGVLKYAIDLETHHGSKSSDEDEQKHRDDELDKKIDDAQRRAADALKRVMGSAKA